MGRIRGQSLSYELIPNIFESLTNIFLITFTKCGFIVNTDLIFGFTAVRKLILNTNETNDEKI